MRESLSFGGGQAEVHVLYIDNLVDNEIINKDVIERLQDGQFWDME